MPVYRFLSILIVAVGISGQAFALLMSPQGMPKLSSPSDNPAVRRYEDGMSALLRKDWTAAETAFREAMKLDPASPLPLIGLADIAAQRKQMREAQSWLQKAAEVAPQNGQPHNSMGRFYYNEKSYAKAEQAFKKALDLSPDNPLFNLDLADLYAISLKKPEASVPYYSKVIKLVPQHAGAHHGLGMVLWNLKQNNAAEASLRKAADLAPNNPISLQALATLLAEQNKSDAAIATFQKALKIQSDFVPALMGTGDVHLGKGDMKQALASYRQVIKLAPKYDIAQLKAGMALQGLGQQLEAESAYKLALASNPKLALAHNNLAWMAADTRTNLASAEQWARKAVELAPQVADFHDTLGWVYRAQTRYSEAEKALNKAIQLLPSAQFYYHLGVVYQEQSKIKEADAAFQKSLSIQKDFVPSQRALQSLRKGKN